MLGGVSQADQKYSCYESLMEPRMTLIGLIDTDQIRVNPLDPRHLWSIWISKRKSRAVRLPTDTLPQTSDL